MQSTNSNNDLPSDKDLNIGQSTTNYPEHANYVLGILFLVYVINFIDRQLLSVFIGPIQDEFGVSDTAMGLLVGFSFALFYSVAGIPIARLADRSNRRNIIAIGLAVWSGMTVLCGFARSFIELALARVGVGVGEAAGTPPSHSLICDYFSIDKRATALGIYSAGVYVGSAISYLCGGYMRANFDWRIAFIVLGAPGLLVALIVRFTIKEPSRQSFSSSGNSQREDISFLETLQYFLSFRSWCLMVAGAACLSMAGYGITMWGYEFFVRVHHVPLSSIGLWMALIVGVGGCIGVYSGGWLVDRFSRKSSTWIMLLPAIVNLASLPLGILFVLVTDSALSAVFLFFFYLIVSFFIPAIHTLTQRLALFNMRATAAAIMLFLINIIGAGLGPFIVGLVNDALEPLYGIEAIRYSLLTLVIIGFFGSGFFYLASRTLESDVSRVNQ